MRVLVDKSVIKKVKEGFKIEALDELVAADADIVFAWPSLLAFLDIDLAKEYPSFSQSALYPEVIAALEAKPHAEYLEHLYDQIFVDCLNWVRSKEAIHPNYLLNKIREVQKTSMAKPFSKPLHHYERMLFEEPYLAIHDLIFYLAWDRVCVDLATLFEYPSTSENVREGLHILRDCLIESFQHITKEQETHPGFFRFLEAIYAYQMREEFLQTYPDAEWQVLCESSQALRPREEFLAVPYTDQTIFSTQNNQHLPAPVKVLTFDSWEKVSKSLNLARYIIEKLKTENHRWKYDIHSTEIICLNP